MTRWAWVAVYTLLLYLSIPIAGTLLDWLQNALGSSFSLWVNLFLLGIAGILLALLSMTRTLPWPQWAMLIGLGIVLAMIAKQLDLPQERVHLLQYGGLGYLVSYALNLQGKNFYLPSVAFAWVFVIGTVDELIQGTLANRVFDLRDIVLNSVSGIAGIVAWFSTRV